MENIYEWLYDYYAEPRLSKLPEFQKGQTERLLSLLPGDQHLFCTDLLDTLQMEWCTAAFELGIRTGMELAAGEKGKYSL